MIGELITKAKIKAQIYLYGSHRQEEIKPFPYNMYDYKTNTFWIWVEDIYEFNKESDDFVAQMGDENPKIMLEHLERLRERGYIPKDSQIRLVPYYNWDDYYTCLENKTRKC